MTCTKPPSTPLFVVLDNECKPAIAISGRIATFVERGDAVQYLASLIACRFVRVADGLAEMSDAITYLIEHTVVQVEAWPDGRLWLMEEDVAPQVVGCIDKTMVQMIITNRKGATAWTLE